MDKNEYCPVIHEFQESTPLLGFTKYKISGLAGLGEGLLFQNALYKTMIRQINKVMTQKVEHDWQGWVEPGDVESMRIALLDLQGTEEVGMLIFCRNYSVAMACVSLLRNLTFNDVFCCDKEGRLKNALDRSRMHETVYKTCFRIRDKHRPGEIDLLRRKGVHEVLKGEHVFQWTHSSLALASEAFISGNYSNCNGFIEGHCEIQMSPGHRFYVERDIDKAVDKHEKETPKVIDKDEAPIWYGVGRGDYLFPYTGNEGLEQPPLVSTRAFWGTVLKNQRTFRPMEGKEKRGRDVVDIDTSLSVPIPPLYATVRKTKRNLLLRKRGKMHYSPLSELLPKTQRRLCYSEKQGTMGRLSFERLKQIHKSYRVPVSLRRTIEYLYQDFAMIMADPFLFEVALDLYDTFATLHAVLTEHLPEKLAGESGRSEANLGVLDEGRVEQIAMLVGAMQNALAHRMAKAHHESSIRDMAIDFRGGLNQILLSSDAVMKCGLGILRRYVLNGKEENKSAMVGVPTCVSFKPGARCYSLEFGIEDKAQLAFFEVDVPHVLHVSSYCDYLHEAFHLIFNQLASMEPEYQDLDDIMFERVSEIFTILLSQIFLFGSEVKLSWYHNLEDYSKSLVSKGTDDRDTIVRFTELMIRLFFALDAVEGIGGEPLSWSKKEWHRKDKDLGDAMERFEYWIKKVGPFFSEYEKFWGENSKLNAREYSINEFKSIYAKIAPIMPKIWLDAAQIFANYAQESIADSDELYKETNRLITDMVYEGLLKGAPLIRSQYLPVIAKDDEGSEQRKEKGELDTMFLVCRMLFSYMNGIKEGEGKEIHLYRRPNDSCVEYPDRKKEWHDFQVDRGVAAMFCPVPERRRERLLKQIVILKSLWDISSSLRARRLELILSNSWGG